MSNPAQILFSLLMLISEVAIAAPHANYCEEQKSEHASLLHTGSTYVPDARKLFPRIKDQKSLFARVRMNRPLESQTGLNLLSNKQNSNELAVLVNSQGRPVHRWLKPGNDKSITPYFSTLDRDASLYSLDANDFLLKLDLQSKTLWKTEGRFHHDIAFLCNGDIAVPEREDRLITYEGVEIPVITDIITILSAQDGRIRKRIKLFPLLENHVPEYVYQQAQLHWMQGKPIEEDSAADILHLNSVFTLQSPLGAKGKAGDLLVYLPRIRTLAIISPESGKLIWHRSNLLPGAEVVHDLTQVSPNSVMLYDNGTHFNGTPEIVQRWSRHFSRLTVVNPISSELLSSFGDGPDQWFYSQFRGRAKKLPNGNIFITASSTRRLLEVNANGELVWEAYFPEEYQNAEVVKILGDEDIHPARHTYTPLWRGTHRATTADSSVKKGSTHVSLDFDWYYFNPLQPLGFQGEEEFKKATEQVQSTFTSCLTGNDNKVVSLKITSSVPVKVQLGSKTISGIQQADKSILYSLKPDNRPELLSIALAPFGRERTKFTASFTTDNFKASLPAPDNACTRSPQGSIVEQGDKHLILCESVTLYSGSLLEAP